MTTTHAQRKALGDYGERVAARFLSDHGMTVLDRNWRCPEGELDIVARDGDELVVCEVKTRTSLRFGTPVEAITTEKAQRLHRLGYRWLRERRAAARDGAGGGDRTDGLGGLECQVRLLVDVIAVTAGARGRADIDHVMAVT